MLGVTALLVKALATRQRQAAAVARCEGGYPSPMRALFLFLLLLAIIGGMKLAGMQLPILDYPLGGPFSQPRIEIVQPSLGLP